MRRARTRWIAGVASGGVLAAGAAVVAATIGDEPTAEAQTAPVLNTAEVVRTDLIKQSSYDGTLGRLAGSTISSAREGVLTSVAEAGEQLGNGSVLYAVDGEPVVALLGEAPAFRDLTAFPEPTELAAPADGVITWLPEPGTQIGPGSVVMRIDGEPVFAIVGDVPAYRDLRDLPTDMTGDDVLQLEQNLAALGLAEQHNVTVDGTFTWQTANALEALQEYNGADADGALQLGEFVVIDAPTTVVDVPGSVGDRVQAGSGASPVVVLAHGDRQQGADVAQLNAALAELGFLDATDAEAADDTFTDATDAALRAFQESVGMEADGTLAFGEIVFLPTAGRVSSVSASVGAALNPGAEVLVTTGEEIVVTLDLPAQDQGTFDVGDPVTVELPNGTEIPGSVASVATVASPSDNGPVFPVEVTLEDTSAVQSLDEAPVEVSYVSDSAIGVVAVPVAALVALREGGYAVELVDGASTRLIGVKVGFFADGLVEVRGNLEPGDQVVVP